MKIKSRAEWLALWKRTGARVFQRAAEHQAAAVPFGKPEVLCDRQIRSKRIPKLMHLAPGAQPQNRTSPAAGLWRTQGAKAAVAPARAGSHATRIFQRHLKGVLPGGAP